MQGPQKIRDKQKLITWTLCITGKYKHIFRNMLLGAKAVLAPTQCSDLTLLTISATELFLQSNYRAKPALSSHICFADPWSASPTPSLPLKVSSRVHGKCYKIFHGWVFQLLHLSEASVELVKIKSLEMLCSVFLLHLKLQKLRLRYDS